MQSVSADNGNVSSAAAAAVTKTDEDIIDEQIYLQNVLIMLHNNETDFYRIFPNDGIVHIPKIYHLLERHHNPPSDGCIVMEDFSECGSITSMIPGLTISQVYNTRMVFNSDYK